MYTMPSGYLGRELICLSRPVQRPVIVRVERVHGRYSPRRFFLPVTLILIVSAFFSGPFHLSMGVQAHDQVNA